MSSGPSNSSLHQKPSESSTLRDSRVVSIYDKYLYDPKDLESSDPRRRELARQASRLKLLGQRSNPNEANGQINNAAATAAMSANARKSITFAQGTKGDPSHTRQADMSQRDSGAFGLGLGMLGGASDSESDSDDDMSRVPAKKEVLNSRIDRLKQQNQQGGLQRQDSWTDRAAAVGQRPPDHASQNPPSLKLMGLKSAKMGGVIPPAPGNNSNSDSNTNDTPQSRGPPPARSLGENLDRDNRILSTSEYGDRDSRHGSAIGFGAPIGHASIDTASAASMVSPPFGPTGVSPLVGPSRVHNNGPVREDPQRNEGRPISPRTALTKQLGLASPNPGATQAPRPSQDNYFGRGPNGTPPQMARGLPSPMGPPSSSSPPNPFLDQGPPGRGAPSPMAGGRPMGPPSPHSPGFGPVPGPNGVQMPPQARPPPPGQYPVKGHPGPNGMPRMGPPPPQVQHQQQSIPPNVLQRGPSPQPPRPAVMSPPGGPMRYNGPLGQGPPPPGPAGRGPPPSNYGRGPPPAQGQRGPLNGPPNGPPGPGRGLPNGAQPRPGMGPSFSDAPGPQRRQSIFRRSMAFFTGGPPGSEPPRNGGGGPPGGQPRRQSLFRRSMAFLGAGPRPMPPPPPQDPIPRVQGFQDDNEKLDHSRKSQFLGDGGAGFEWDATGRGAKFWRRFSMAQKKEHDTKLQEGSRAWHESMRQGKRKLIVMAVLALLLIVGVIVGVIVWREIVSPSGKKDEGMPGSTYRGGFGGSDTGGGETNANGATGGPVTGTTLSSRSSNNLTLVERDLFASVQAHKRHRKRRQLTHGPSPASVSLADLD